MTLGFQDIIDITIDSIAGYSEEMYSASWFNNIEHSIYVAIIQNNRFILDQFKPYQIQAMKELIQMNNWICYDYDISMPVVRPLDYIMMDKVAIKHGAD